MIFQIVFLCCLLSLSTALHFGQIQHSPKRFTFILLLNCVPTLCLTQKYELPSESNKQQHAPTICFSGQIKKQFSPIHHRKNTTRPRTDDAARTFPKLNQM